MEAGALLLGALASERTSVGTKSSGTDMVSEMDRASEALIVRHLRAERPEDSILGEEGGDIVSGTSGVRWVVDPLDGTTNYLYRLPAWAVSIAAEVAGVVVAGAVCDPSHALLFRASAGGGAWLDDLRLVLAPGTGPKTLGHALVATGFPYAPEGRARQARVLCDVLPFVRDIRRAGSAALDLCSVAVGQVDAYYERNLGPWDFAAGALVAAEAGALVTSVDGGPPTPGVAGSAMACHPDLATSFPALIRNAEAAAGPLW